MTRQELRDALRRLPKTTPIGRPALLTDASTLAPLLDLADAVDAWCAAKCSVPRQPHDSQSSHDRGERCVGANHLEDCPVELARQDVLAASMRAPR